MQHTKLYETLKTLSPWEWNHLQDFIDSPFHLKNIRVKALFYHFRQFKKDLSAATDRETCFQAIYGDAPFEEQKLFNISSLLHRKIQEFFSFSLYRQRKADQVAHLMEVQLLRQDWDALPKSARQIRSMAKKIDVQGSYSYDFYAYRAGMMQIKKDLETQRLSNEAFYSTIGHLDRFYLESRLKLACEYLNRGHMLQHSESRILDIDPMIAHFLGDELAVAEDASLQLYHSIYQMLSQPGLHAAFTRCVWLLREVPLHAADLRDGTAYCINHCIRRINAGHHDYLAQLFELYAWAIEREILLEDGELGEWHFKNIVQTAIRNGRLQWIEAFVQRCSPLLPEKVRENAYAFNQASIYFERKAYSEAKKLLLRVQFTDIFYSLDSKVLLAKIYYEEGDFGPLRSLLRSLSVFLRRESILSGSQRSIYANFIKAVGLLGELKEEGKFLSESVFIAKFEKLKAYKTDSPNMAQFNWFCSKMEENSAAWR